jgi:hypothetical protein
VHVCRPYDHYSNDPRMEAAYYLSLCPISALLALAEDIADLLRLPADGDTMNGNISAHLLKCIDRLVQEGGFAPSAELTQAMKQHSY